MSTQSGSNWKLHAGLTILVLITMTTIFLNDLHTSTSYPTSVSEIVAQNPFRKKNSVSIKDLGGVEPEMGDGTSFNSITEKSMYNYRNITAPSVYLKLKGGLGNQLFQYACHYALARKYNWPLYTFISLNVSTKTRNFTVPQGREFALDQFSVPLFLENIVDETWTVTSVNYVDDSDLLSGKYAKDKILSLSSGDYCQSEAFFNPFQHELKELFTQNLMQADLENKDFMQWRDLINSTERSVAVHIRRGDFLRINASAPTSYYKDSMTAMAKLTHEQPLVFFIFTDDIKFAKDEFLHKNGSVELENGSGGIYIVSDLKLSSLQEFYLMSRCSHDIIPNSSFGWWAAYLNPNPNKIVIAAHHNLALWDSMYPKPEQHLRRDFLKWQYMHIYYPYGWITVNPFS